MSKFEKKLSKFAIPNLTMVIITACILGYLLEIASPQSASLLYMNPGRVMRGEVWRVFSWILIPPSSFSIFTIINLFFYYHIGRTLEKIWGDFKYNVFIFSGMFYVVFFAFFLYFIVPAITSLYGSLSVNDMVSLEILLGKVIGNFTRTTYLQASTIMAFALAIPDMQVLMYFIIPIKMKWFALLWGIFIFADLLSYLSYGLLVFAIAAVMIMAALLNFIITVKIERKKFKKRRGAGGFTHNFAEEARKRGFRVYEGTAAGTGNAAGAANIRPAAVSKHKCVICGKTEITSPDSIFRFCSKCNGNYEYCEDHLYTHEHK